MKDYIEIRFRKIYVIILGIVLLLVCSLGGYYYWNLYYPDVSIQIGAGATGKEGILIEAPHIATAGDIAPSIQLKLNNIVMQHEFLCTYIKDNYKASDVKLDMDVKNNQTILKYYGTVTDANGKTVDYNNDIMLEFGFNADITYKR